MLATRRLRLAPEWDGRFTRMVVLSGVAHVSVVVLILALAVHGGPRPLPMVAYTVEITDPSALGGRLPPGKISTQPTRDAAAAAPPPGEPAAEQPSVPQPPAPAPEPEPVAKVEPPKPEPPKPEPPKAEPPKPEAPKPEAVKIEPAKKPEPPKPPPKPEAKPEPKPPPKPVAEKPKPPEKPAAEKPAEKPVEKPAAEKPKPAAEKPPQAAKPAGQGGPADANAAPKDAYAAAAERWRTKSQGQGLGGTQGGSGPIGTGGEGPGGGGQLVGVEFIAYRHTVINTVKGHWTNVIGTPGLVAAVRFSIASDGTLGGIRLERSSGNTAYDSSALRAVQRTQQLPPPPPKYATEFGEFVIEFHSEESGGRESG